MRFAVTAPNVRYRSGQYLYITIKIAVKKVDHQFSFSIFPTEIARLVPDYRQRLFYISGPPGMVTALSGQVLELSVPAKQIHLDSFTGYE